MTGFPGQPLAEELIVYVIVSGITPLLRGTKAGILFNVPVDGNPVVP